MPIPRKKMQDGSEICVSGPSCVVFVKSVSLSNQRVSAILLLREYVV